MDEAVDNIHTSPLYVKTSLNERLTNIAVDSNVRTPADDKKYDVMYIGTTKGKVLKVINVEMGFDVRSRTSKRKPVVIEEMQVFPYHVPVANVQVVQPKNSAYKTLIVLSDHEVKALPLHWCNAAQVQSCKSCVALQDPHCAWNLNLGKCVDSTQFNNTDASSLLQDLVRGKHLACTGDLHTSSYTNKQTDAKEQMDNQEMTTNEISNSGISADITNKRLNIEPQEEIDIIIDFNVEDNEIPYAEGQAMKCDEPYEYTKATVTTASLVTAFVALFIGLASGFLTSRKCSKDGYRNCGHHYLEQQNSARKTSALHHTESGYTTAPCNNHLAASTTSSTTSSNATTSSAASSGGTNSSNTGSSVLTSDIKNSNLLVNITNKTEPEKSNLSTATETSVIYNGTIPRNGTLCKKVYL
jgi:semaphorin 6